MTKTQRLIELMMRVYEKRTFTVEDMASEFGVSYRTMLRYLHELSGMGVPLYAEAGRAGGYSLLPSAARKVIMTDSIQPAADPFRRVLRPEIHIVGIEFQAPFTAVYMAKVMIPKLWSELERRRHEIVRQKQTGSITGVTLSRSKIYRYVAGVEVSHLHEIPQGMVGLTLPACEYAVYTHQGGSDRAETDQTFFWLAEKLRQRGLEPNMTAYSLESRHSGDAQAMDIYIPLLDNAAEGARPESVHKPR